MCIHACTHTYKATIVTTCYYIKFNKIHIHLLLSTHTRTHAHIQHTTHTHAHAHAHAHTHSHTHAHAHTHTYNTHTHTHALAHTHTHTRAHIQHTHTHTHTTFHTFPVFAVGVEFPVQNSVQLLNYFHDHNQLLPPTESDELRNTAGTSPAQPDLCDHTSLSYAGDCGYGQ